MSSTSASLKTTSTGQLIPQAYDLVGDAYQAATARQLGSSEYGLQVLQRHLSASTYETVSVTTTVVGLSSGSYNSKLLGLIQVATTSIRFLYDGSNPTTAVGHVADDGDIIVLESSAELANFRAILTGSSTATLTVTYST